jgi:hypothetical protein
MQLLTLGDVVDAGHRGETQRFQREGMQAQRVNMDRQERQRGLYEAASKRATEAMMAAEKSGLDRQSAMLKGSEQFGQALIEAGDMRGYLENESKIHPLRLRTRQEAVQRFQMDGDKARLIRSVYATIPNGEDVVDVEEVAGGPMPDRGTGPKAAPMEPKPQGLAAAIQEFDGQVLDPFSQAGNREVPVIQPGRPGDGRLGAPSGKSKLRVKVSTGDTRDVDFDQFMVGVQKLSQDPELEIKLNYERELARIKAGGQIDVVNARGGQQRQTETQKADARKQEGLANFDRAMKRDETNNAARMDRTKVQQAGADRRDATPSGGGGRGGNGNAVQSRTVDQDGYVILNFRDGSSKRAMVDGKPVRASEWSKRVDAMTKTMASSIEGSSKPVQQLRQQAEQMLMGAPPVTAAQQGSKAQTVIDRLLGN